MKVDDTEIVVVPSVIFGIFSFAIIFMTNLFYYSRKILRNFPRLNTPSFSDT